jgi:hypothetical protein
MLLYEFTIRIEIAVLLLLGIELNPLSQGVSSPLLCRLTFLQRLRTSILLGFFLVPGVELNCSRRGVVLCSN